MANINKLLILTDINVSNLHLMLANIMKKHSTYNVRFLNVRTPKSFFDNSEWYISEKDEVDISCDFNRQNLFGKIRMAFNTVMESDIVFCTGAVALLARILRRPYIYMCTGSDLDQYSKYGCNIFQLQQAKEKFSKRMLRPVIKFLYRNAIKGSNMTIIAPYQYNDICTLGYKKLAFIPHPLEQEYLATDLDARKKNSEKLQKEYDCTWILFSATRQEWNQSLINENDYKGNDIIIRSFYNFTEKMKISDAKLFLIEKGSSVNESKKLIQKLGLEKYVVWLQPMNRKKLMEFYSGAHICFDQFSQGCLALCAVESLACGSPTVSYIGPLGREAPFYQEDPPVLNSNDPRVIANFIEKIVKDDDYRLAVERKSNEWVKQHCSYGKLVESFDNMINYVIQHE